MQRFYSLQPCAKLYGLALLVATVSLAFLAPCVQAEGISPQRWLAEEKGLVQQQRRWLLPAELAMQQRVRSLPELEEKLLQSQSRARQVAESLLAAHTELGLQIAAAEKRVQSLRAAREELRSEARQQIVDARIEQLVVQLQKLRALYVPPEQISSQPAVRDSLIELTNRRNDLAARVLWIHDMRSKLRDQYGQLATDVEVASALRQLGEGYTLGSGKDYNSEPFLRRMAAYEKHVFTDEVPLYRDRGELRVAGFINRTPVTFTWHDSSEPTMLTASVIEAAGLKVPDDAPQMQRQMPDGRTLTVRQFEVPYLRFGRHVLTNVLVFALPPEGENLGTRISPAAFEGLSPTAQPEKFRLKLQ